MALSLKESKLVFTVYVLLGLSTLSSDAFVPTTTTPKVATEHSILHDPVRNNPIKAAPSVTALYAGNGNLIDRFARVVKSNVNKFLSGIENPEKVIMQAVDDMQTDLVKIRQAYAEAITSQRRLQRQKDQADAVASDWYTKAQLALTKGHENLAREALARRQQAVDQADDLQKQMDSQNIAVERLYSAMTTLETKIREAASKKEQLIARARTAKSTAQVNDMLSGLTGKTSMDAFVRMEQKVEALEAAAEASSEMTYMSGKSNDPVSLEAEFRLLEKSSKVDDQLQAMKEEMNSKKILPGSATTTTNDGQSIRVSIPVGRGEKIFVQ